MATVFRPNGFRKKRTTMVNPKWTFAQKLAGFAGKAKQRAAERAKAARRPKPARRPSKAAYSVRQSRPAGAGRKSRPNISAIVTAGLNPYSNEKGHSTMAKQTKQRRRPHASKKHSPARRHYASKGRTNPHGSHRPRTKTKYRTRTVVKYRYRARSNGLGRRRPAKRNPSSAAGMGTKSLLINSAVATLNGVASRWVPNFLLGSNNVGPVSYGANIATGLVGAYAAKRFLGKAAGQAALIGLGVSLILRAAQDFTPWGAALALNGYGDSGMGALMPMDFLNPQQYAEDNQSVYKPPSWRPLPAAPPAAAPARRGMAGTYRRNTYA